MRRTSSCLMATIRTYNKSSAARSFPKCISRRMIEDAKILGLTIPPSSTRSNHRRSSHLQPILRPLHRGRQSSHTPSHAQAHHGQGHSRRRARACRLTFFLGQFAVKICVLNAELPLNSWYHTVQEYIQGCGYIIATTRAGAGGEENQEERAQEEGPQEEEEDEGEFISSQASTTTTAPAPAKKRRTRARRQACRGGEGARRDARRGLSRRRVSTQL
ncbi:hypothetical protein DFH06DRAFT_472408 [Mycena polygramma]|nr:hypothetical protein DFH06DRAFT_472408 [Mycena polygramma]